MENSRRSEKEELECLQKLQDLITEKGDELVLAYTHAVDEDLLLMVLRCRKYNINSAFERIRRIAHVRKKYPDVFERLSPKALYHVHALAVGGAEVLKNRDPLGRHILYLKADFWNPDTLSLEDMVGGLILLGLEMIQQIETQLNGVVIIVDAGKFTLKQGRQATPAKIHKYAQILMNASPLKIKGAHLVNAPGVFNVTISLIKMFLTHKLRNRIYGHGSSLESLHKWISPNILPECLGGVLTEEEAFDRPLIHNLYNSPEKEEFFQSLIKQAEKQHLQSLDIL